MWVLYAVLSSVFASLTSILAKVGIKGVPSNLATAIRTTVVLIMSILMVFITHETKSISSLGAKNWLFLLFSGLATGVSWLCFYKALEVGPVSKVVPIDKLSVVLTIILAFIILGEKITAKAIVGAVLITAGTLLMCI